jgi:membrane protein DedA with SNARE-associated domain
VTVTEHFIEQFTYLGIFLTLFSAGLGLPIPEEAPIVAAGILAHQRVVQWWLALPVCLAGVLLGDVILYWAGRRWGETVLTWPIIRRVVTPARVVTLERGYRRHGVKIIFLARHVMGIRAGAFVVAGTVGIPFWKFLAANGAAALISVPFTFGMAYLFTDQIVELLRDVHRIERWLMLIALAAAAGWLAFLGWRRSQRIE